MKMLETSNSQYDSFLFWRQPIPELDLSELEDMGLAEVVSIQKNQTKSSKMPKQEEEVDHELSKFSSFNYWREPIASIDTLDFSLIL